MGLRGKGTRHPTLPSALPTKQKKNVTHQRTPKPNTRIQIMTLNFMLKGFVLVSGRLTYNVFWLSAFVYNRSLPHTCIRVSRIVQHTYKEALIISESSRLGFLDLINSSLSSRCPSWICHKHWNIPPSSYKLVSV